MRQCGRGFGVRASGFGGGLAVEGLACDDLAEQGLDAVAVRRGGLGDGIERRLVESGEREIPSSWVGERAMEELVAIDALAAVRFASVFRDFQAAGDYLAFFDSLERDES